MASLQPSSARTHGSNRDQTGLDNISPAPTVATKSVFSEGSATETTVTVPEIRVQMRQPNDEELLPADTKLNGNETAPAPDEQTQLQPIADGPASASDHQSTEIPFTSHSANTPAPNDYVPVNTDSFGEVDQPDRHATLTELNQRLGQSTHARDKLLLDQVRLDSERQKATDVQEILEESQASLLRILQEAIALAGPNETVHRILPLCERVIADLDAYKQQSQRVKAIEANFRNQELNLLNMDKELSYHVRASFADVPYTTNDATDAIPLTSPPLDATPPLLQAYWDALGAREHLRDEIFDLDQQHRYDAAEYERMEELRVAPARSESEFEREYEHQRDELTRHLYDTIARADHLRMECVAHGIDPNTSRKAISVSSSVLSLPEAAAHSDSGFYNRSMQFQAVEKPLARRSTDNLEELGVTARVESWLSGVAQPREASKLAQPG